MTDNTENTKTTNNSSVGYIKTNRIMYPIDGDSLIPVIYKKVLYAPSKDEHTKMVFDELLKKRTKKFEN